MKPLERFYQLLAELEQGLGGMRRLGECTGRVDWPSRGVYFFFGPSELRPNSKTSRVVRVGTHAVSRGSRTTLWSRLRAHRGTSSGGGNHRGSIFRLHVGEALIRSSRGNLVCASWGKGSSAPRRVRDSEVHLEERVSAYLSKLSVLWLAVEDEAGVTSDRAYVERNAIALLTGVDPPSHSWVGNHSGRKEIRQSGLWNLDHLGKRADPGFTDVLERYVELTIQACRGRS